MRKNAIQEFKLWTVFLAIGSGVLATEVGVKATRPNGFSSPSTDADLDAAGFPVSPVVAKAIQPEELSATLLVESVVMIESGGRPRMVGRQGERGLMQIKAGTWKDTTRQLYGHELPFSRAFDPEANRAVGTAYLAHLHQFLQSNRAKWKSDERTLLLACYNAGPARVAKAGFNIRRLPASTRDYVVRASALHDDMLRRHALTLEKAEPTTVQLVELPDSSRRGS